MLGLFKKRKDILAVVLTSSDVKRARRAYESVKNSPRHTLYFTKYSHSITEINKFIFPLLY